MFLQRNFWAINLALISLLVWASVDLFLVFVNSKLDQKPLPQAVTATCELKQPEAKPKGYFAMLTGNNIFDPFGEGHFIRPEVPKPVQYVPPPPPPLSTQLRLRGTVAGGADFGLAIVDDNTSRKQEVVKIGGRLRDATLVSVTRDKAVFEVGGRQETLALLEKDVPAGPPPGGSGSVLRGADRPPLVRRPGAPSERPSAAYTPPSPMSNSGGAADMFKALSPSRYAVDRQKAVEMSAEPDKLGEQGNLASAPDGLTVNGLPPGGLAEKAGLRSGDVLKKINGQPVSTPVQALQEYQKGLNLPSVKVEVVRNGRPVTLNYELR